MGAFMEVAPTSSSPMMELWSCPSFVEYQAANSASRRFNLSYSSRNPGLVTSHGPPRWGSVGAAECQAWYHTGREQYDVQARAASDRRSYSL